MQLKNEIDLSKEEKWSLGLKYKQCLGVDTFVIFLFAVVAIAVCVSVTLAVLGFILRDKGIFMLVTGIIACILTVVLGFTVYLLILFRKKRAVVRVQTAKVLADFYGETALMEWYISYRKHFDAMNDVNSPAAKALDTVNDRSFARKVGMPYDTPPVIDDNRTARSDNLPKD